MQEQLTAAKRNDALRMSNKESNRFTRECLQTALIYLMGEKSFEKISISELVRRSGVSRTAFYRNYSSKEEILNEACTSILDHLSASLSDTRYQSNPVLWYHDFFQAIKEHSGVFQLFLQAQLLNSPAFNIYFLSKRPKARDKSEAHYEFLAWQGALSTILVHWFQDGMQESPDSMAELCARILEAH